MSSGACKATTTMSDSEDSAISEASDAKTGRRYLKGMKGHDIFEEYDYSKLSEDQDTEASEMVKRIKIKPNAEKVKRQILGID